MNLSKELILIIVISVNVTIYSQENMGYFPGPLAYFGSPHMTLFNQKVSFKKICSQTNYLIVKYIKFKF